MCIAVLRTDISGSRTTYVGRGAFNRHDPQPNFACPDRSSTTTVRAPCTKSAENRGSLGDGRGGVLGSVALFYCIAEGRGSLARGGWLASVMTLGVRARREPWCPRSRP